MFGQVTGIFMLVVFLIRLPRKGVCAEYSLQAYGSVRPLQIVYVLKTDLRLASPAKKKSWRAVVFALQQGAESRGNEKCPHHRRAGMF